MAVLNTTEIHETPEFFSRVVNIIKQTRKFVGRTADLTTTVTYFKVGRMIEKKESKAHHFRIKPLQDFFLCSLCLALKLKIIKKGKILHSHK